jgi:hypothetical protein
MKKPTFYEFTRARLDVVQLEIASLADVPENRDQLRILRANEHFLYDALGAYQDYLDETALQAS